MSILTFQVAQAQTPPTEQEAILDRALPYSDEVPDTLGRQGEPNTPVRPNTEAQDQSANANGEAGNETSTDNEVKKAAQRAAGDSAKPSTSDGMIDIERALREAEAESKRAKKSGVGRIKQADEVTKADAAVTGENSGEDGEANLDAENDLDAAHISEARRKAARRRATGRTTRRYGSTANGARGTSNRATRQRTTLQDNARLSTLGGQSQLVQRVDQDTLVDQFDPTRPTDRNANVFSYGDNRSGFRYLTIGGTNENDPYGPLGVRVGSFIFYPEIEIAGIYDSNPLQAPDGADDLAMGLRPNFVLNSDWNRHALQLSANGTFSFYKDLDDQNEEQWAVALRSRVDITQNTSLSFDAEYSSETDEPGSLDSSSGTGGELGKSDTLSFYGSLNHRFDNVFFRVGGHYADYGFDDAANADGTTEDNSDRDYEEYAVNGRIGYEFYPGYSVFTDAEVRFWKFDRSLDNDGVNRDGTVYTVRAGLAKDITNKLYGTAAIGYTEFTPDSNVLDNVDSVVLDANLSYQMNALTRFTLNLSSGLDVTSLAGSSASVVKRGSLGVSHAFQRNLVGTATVTYENTDYEGIADEEDVLTINVGANYQINRSVALRFTYEHADHDLSTGGDYKEDEIRLGVVLRR